MKIGLYKVGPKIYFQHNEEDHSAISIEVTRIAQILAEGGHQVYILSHNDYIPGSITNVSSEDPGTLDKALIYNGMDNYDIAIQACLKYTDNINLIVTDLSLMPSAINLTKFKNVYTQSPSYRTYGHIEEHELYQYSPTINIKDIQIYFGGTERGRTADFFEYVYRPNVMWYGKSDTLGIRKYIPYYEHLEMMKRTKYSIIIGDAAYNEINFVTPRYYECLRYDVIAFVDHKYDGAEIMISKYDFRRVHNYLEMLNKIKYLESNPDHYQQLLRRQQLEIRPDHISGVNILKALI